jgi:hypothetical protein
LQARPAAGAASRQCRVLRLNRNTFRVTIQKGRASCHTATRVLKDFLSGHGTFHGPRNGPASKQSYTLDGWTCGYGAGGGACIRGGRTYRTARDQIVADAIGRIR